MATVFVSENNTLNAAYVRWLEHKLVQRLNEFGTRTIKNVNEPSETKLSIQDEAFCKSFLKWMLEVMPVTGLTAFESPLEDLEEEQSQLKIKSQSVTSFVDTIIVPTGKTGQGLGKFSLVRIVGIGCEFLKKKERHSDT